MKNYNVKKVVTVMFLVMTFMLSIPYKSVYAEEAPQFRQAMYFYYESNSVGYNSAPGTKIKGWPVATVDVMSGTIGKTTNYLIVGADGVQITPATLQTYQGKYISFCPRYYAAEHEGIVYLRTNTGGTGTGYYVAGEWEANHRE